MTARNHTKGLNRLNWSRVVTIARTEVRQFTNARDQWIPMLFLGSLFFVIIPGVLLLSIGHIGQVGVVQKVSQTLDVLPQEALAKVGRTDPKAKVMYALSVYLFAPIAIVVPLTICSAIGAATIVGERERGTGEFLANSPAGVREIFLGKLLASLLPGYAVTVIGFAAYSLVVNLLGSGAVGRWFFPTPDWWVYVLWTIPAFLVLSLSIVLRLSARVSSTAAAQQAAGLISLPLIGMTYSQSTSSLLGSGRGAFTAGAVVWAIAVVSLVTGMRTVKRSRLLTVLRDKPQRSARAATNSSAAG